MIDTLIIVAGFTYRTKLSRLLLLDQRHVRSIFNRNDLSQWTLVHVSDAQRRFDITACTGIYDSGRSDLHRREQPEAGAFLAGGTSTDIDRHVSHIILGDAAAPVVVGPS